jgi:hypothetical protein
MSNPTDISKKEALDQGKEHPEAEGKKAIEMNKKINRQSKPAQQVDREEKQDAERWRNEG